MTVAFREAQKADLPAILALLQDDALGSAREGAEMALYEAAFDDMARDVSFHQVSIILPPCFYHYSPARLALFVETS